MRSRLRNTWLHETHRDNLKDLQLDAHDVRTMIAFALDRGDTAMNKEQLFALADAHNAHFVWDGEIDTGPTELHSVDYDRLWPHLTTHQRQQVTVLIQVGVLRRLPVPDRHFLVWYC